MSSKKNDTIAYKERNIVKPSSTSLMITLKYLADLSENCELGQKNKQVMTIYRENIVLTSC